MTLLDLHVELAVTNELLMRIAGALDRAFPLTQVDRREHPLVGIADVSRFDAGRAAAVDSNRANIPLRASQRVRFGDKARDESRQSGAAAETGASDEAAQVSVTGAWDHDDPLDNLEESDREWPNYAGRDV